MDLLLVMGGLALAGAIASAVVFVYERAAAPGAAAKARIGVAAASDSTAASPLRRRKGKSAGILGRVPVSGSARERMAIELERAGKPIRVNEFLAIRLGCAAAMAFVAVLTARAVSGAAAAVLLAGVGGLGLGWFAPRYMLGRMTSRRLQRIEEQLPDALTAIAKSLRAGTGLLQALAYSAAETPAPLGPELQGTIRDLQLGADPETVFHRLAERVGSADLDIAVTAIVIQRTVGGNLSEILTNVTNTVRERAKLHAEVRVLTSRQRLTGNLVALLPALVALAFLSMNPHMGSLLINTEAGRIALAVGLGFELLGLWLIRRLAVIDV